MKKTVGADLRVGPDRCPGQTRRFAPAAFALILIAATAVGAGSSDCPIGPDLTRLLTQAKASDLIPVSIILKEQVNTDQLEARCRDLDKQARWSLVVNELKSLSVRSQQDLLAKLNGYQAQGQVSDIDALWIVNAVYCRATLEVISELAGRDDVEYLETSTFYTPGGMLAITPETMKNIGQGGIRIAADALPEWNVRKVGADSVWHLLGYHGDSVIVGHIDTGCNYRHEDLARHMWTDSNYPNHGWNFELSDNDPMDVSGHGTHTSGTVASDGTAGDTCGMAPRAQIMSCRVRSTADSTAEEQVFEAMQFVVAPTLSPAHHADCVTMSLGWELAWSPRQATWRQAVTNVSTAGLPFLIAAGNERGGYQPPYDLRCSGNVPGPWRHPAEASGGRGGAISIAAVDIHDSIAYFSSNGPVTWDTIKPYQDYAYPPGLLKPDVASPGESITSCNYQDTAGYLSNWSGTSMATPCVAGIVALMLQKNPDLLPWQADSILQMTVLPLGSQPKNNDFGTGRVSAYHAVMMTPRPALLRTLSYDIDDTPPGGNGDHIINPGETVGLPTWVRTPRGYTTLGVRGYLRLTHPDSNVTLLDTFRHIGNISGGDSASTGRPGFRFSVAARCTNGYRLPLAVAYYDTLDSMWTSPYDLQVGAAILAGAGLVVHDSPPGGNGNGILDPGETDSLEIGIQNMGMGNASNVVVHLVSGDARFQILDSIGTYGAVPHDSTVFNSASRFRVHADSSIPKETPLPCTLRITGTGYSATRFYSIVCGRLTTTDPEPDGPRTPSYYYAYDNVDSAYTQHPTFKWIEIRGRGTRLSLLDDQTVPIPLPATFGPFRYYDRNYDTLSICSNGFIIPGSSSISTHNNLALPTDSLGGPAICPSWDDYYPPADTGVWYYRDTTDHAFIVEWDSVHYRNPPARRDKFEVVLYDSTLRAVSGNNTFAFEYLTANNYDSNTVGIQDPTRAIAINALYDGVYHRACAPIVPHHAIFFTSSAPTGLEEAGKPPLASRLALLAAPSPLRGAARLRLSLPMSGRVRLTVHDVTGRRVCTLINADLKSGQYTIPWNRTDDHGRTVPAGVYIYRLVTPNGSMNLKTVVLN